MNRQIYLLAGNVSHLALRSLGLYILKMTTWAAPNDSDTQLSADAGDDIHFLVRSSPGSGYYPHTYQRLMIESSIVS